MAAEPAHGALFLDFDGTLAAIVEDPTGARPLPGVPALLAELARPFALVAVVSGRPTAFLAEVLGDPAGVTLAGLYGLERALHGPEHAAWAAVIDAGGGRGQGRGAGRHLRRAQGADGDPALAPRARDRRDWVLAFAERQHARHGLSVHPGRAERELRPPLDVDKGTVVRALAAEHAGQLRATAVFGDDIGDLPAFAAARASWPRPTGGRSPRSGWRRSTREPARGGRRGRPHRAGRRGRRRAPARAGRGRHRGGGAASVLSGGGSSCGRQLVRPPVGRGPGAHGRPQGARPPGALGGPIVSARAGRRPCRRRRRG